MNTYNENLQNTILASLQSQDLSQKNLKAQYNTSKFTLYYAQGAIITASEKLAAAEADQASKAFIKEQATHASNIATNLLSSATLANQYLGQSVSNVAVCAANVQIATTAITRLASDVGSIFSIINAADFDTDIYVSANEVKGLVDDAAYLAEFTSKMAMDASTSTSQVSGATVLNSAKTTTAQLSNLVQIASTAYDTSSQVVTADNATLASTSAIEKTAEGNIECIGIDYNTSKSAYKWINQALNLDLRVELAADQYAVSAAQKSATAATQDTDTDTGAAIVTIEDGTQPVTAANPQSATTFTVKFDCVKSPFPGDPPQKPGYPIDTYYILLVKESKRLVFTLSDAESIILNENNRYQYASIKASCVAKTGSVSETINYLKFKPKKDDEGKDITGQFESMLDSDGDRVTAGQNYVAFVVAIYLNEYKRKINDFDDFLSAPSQAFCMTYRLAPAQKVSFEAIAETDDKQKKADNQQHQEKFRTAYNLTLKPNFKLAEAQEKIEQSSEFTHQLTFEVSEPISSVSYRCMLLPTGNLEGLLTANLFKAFFEVERELAEVSNFFDPEIRGLQAQAMTIEMQLQQVDNNNRKDLEEELDEIRKRIAKSQNDKENALEISGNVVEGGPGFLFDLTLAEQVTSGNFIPAVPFKEKPAAQSDANKAQGPSKKYVAYIGPGTTDNFGNLLAKGKQYIPVVLSLPDVAEENLSQYTNAISGVNTAKPFKY